MVALGEVDVIIVVVDSSGEVAEGEVGLRSGGEGRVVRRRQRGRGGRGQVELVAAKVEVEVAEVKVGKVAMERFRRGGGRRGQGGSMRHGRRHHHEVITPSKRWPRSRWSGEVAS